METPFGEELESYLKKTGWKLRLNTMTFALYSRSNDEVVVPTSPRRKTYNYICSIALAIIAESENRSVELLRRDITPEGGIALV